MYILHCIFSQEKIIELKKTQESTGESSSTGRNDILAQVLGPERHGRLRQGGVGATATNTWGPRDTNNEVQRENQELKAELKKVREKGDDTARKVDELLSMMTEFMKKSSVPNAHSNNQVLLSHSTYTSNLCSITLFVYGLTSSLYN